MKTRHIIKYISLPFFIMLTAAWGVSRNEPNERAVEEILKETGGQHWVDGMDVDELGSTRVFNHRTQDDTYFHVFTSYLDETHQYRVIIFNNDQQYLGYYLASFEPVDFETGAVLLDAQDGSSYYALPLSTKGFPKRVRTGMYLAEFIKNDAADPRKNTTGKTEPYASPGKNRSGSPEPDYRDWTVTIQGKTITFNAVFVRVEDDQIVLKESKRGLVSGLPGHVFSEKDQEYLKTVLELQD